MNKTQNQKFDEAGHCINCFAYTQTPRKRPKCKILKEWYNTEENRKRNEAGMPQLFECDECAFFKTAIRFERDQRAR